MRVIFGEQKSKVSKLIPFGVGTIIKIETFRENWVADGVLVTQDTTLELENQEYVIFHGNSYAALLYATDLMEDLIHILGDTVYRERGCHLEKCITNARIARSHLIKCYECGVEELSPIVSFQKDQKTH